jgi:hypothetical protein
MWQISSMQKVAYNKKRLHQIYRIRSGLIVAGTTTVIGKNLGWNKENLLGWTRKKIIGGWDTDKLRDWAADVGTAAHFLIECHHKGLIPDLINFSPETCQLAYNCFEAYLDWESAYDVRAEDTETQLVSEIHLYGGTRDLAALVRGTRSIIDYKTSTHIYDEHKIQGAALCHLDWENRQSEETLQKLKLSDVEFDEFGSKPSEWTPFWLLRLDKKDGSFSPTDYAPLTLRSWWRAFLCCLELDKIHRGGSDGN